MERGGAKRADSRKVYRRGIPLIGRKSIARVAGIELNHALVPVDLGNYGSGSDGEAKVVTTHDGTLRAGVRRKREGVEKERIRHTGEGIEGTVHGEARGGDNAVLVNFSRGGLTDGCTNRERLNQRDQPLAVHCGELL
jgi:hypothetical protein